jgi:hypothetical protein
MRLGPAGATTTIPSVVLFCVPLPEGEGVVLGVQLGLEVAD